VLSEDERNVAFTRLLQMSNEKCDKVIRTLFSSALSIDDWEALCRDRHSYSIISRRTCMPASNWSVAVNCWPQAKCSCTGQAARARR
jgi:hypothetical protein